MDEMPLVFVLGGWGFGVGESIFYIGVLAVGVLSLAFCPKIAIMVKGGVVPVYGAKC